MHTPPIHPIDDQATLPPSADPPRPRRVDFRYLTFFLVLAVFLGTGTHFLHAYQVRRNADAFLALADRAEADNEPDRAADYLGRYVRLRPNDLDTRARYALLIDRLGKAPKYVVYLAMDVVLQRDPHSERPEIRRRAAELAMDLRRPGDARVHIERLLAKNPDDADLEDRLGRCEEEAKQFAKARAAYESALKHAPGRVVTAYRLARLLRGTLNPAPQADRVAEADKVMDAAVLANPDSFEARMVRCRYYQAGGNLDAAEKDLDYARDKLAPDNADVLLASADLARDRTRPAAARRYLQRGRELYPKDPRFPLALARLELRSGGGDRPVAVEQLRESLRHSPADPETLFTLADLFLDAGGAADARELLGRLAALNVTPQALDFLRARLLAGEGKVGEAVALLEQSRANFTAQEGTGFLNAKSNLLLGGWYEQLGNPERQLAAYERMLRDDPTSVKARAGKAAALARLGRNDDALTLYRSLVAEAPALRLNVARLLAAQNLSLPPERRDWTEAEALLRDAPPDVRDRVESRLLLVDLLALSGRPKEAEAEAEAACRDRPKEVRFWLARAALAGRGAKADPAKAQAVLDEAEKQLGDSVDLRLARADRLAGKPPAEARWELLRLEDKAGDFPAADRGRLEAGLAAAHLARTKDTKEAVRLLTLAAEHLPGDIAVRQQLFELAMADGDDAAAARQAEELQRIEGDEGVLWRFEDAARKVAAARKGDAAALPAARDQLAEVAARRPGWSRMLVLEGEIAELEGRTDLALENYQKAVERGERSPRVVRRAVQLLATRRRTDEARQLLQKAIESSPASAAGDLNRMLVEVSVSEGESRQQSVEMARSAVSPNSKDYRDFVWLGQMLASLGEKKEAEAALRKALRMRENAPDAWVALVALLAESGRKDEARVELERSQRVLPEPARQMVLGPCREALGEAQGAEAVYLALLKERPNDPAVKRTLAQFYLRNGDGAKAEHYLQELAGGEGPDAAWGRRSLALILATTGDFQKTREALKLLDKNLNGRWSGPEDQRTRAMVLALRPGDRRASIEVMEESFLRLRPTPAEEFLLAQLYEADRNWPKASERLLSLATSKHGATPEVLAYLVRALLRHNQVGDARNWLDRLEKQEPGSARVVELKAHLLKEEGKGDEAGRLLTEFARKEADDKKDPVVLGRCAGLLADLGRPAEAEELFRLYAARSEGSRPESVLALATFLAGHNRPGEALDLCERAAARCPPESVAGVAVGAVRLCEPTAKDLDRVRAWLDGEVRKKPDSVPLLVARADLMDASGDYAGAEQVYRDLLARNPHNVLALNNLSWLLAVRDNKGEEALKLIEKAIEIAGPVGDLLDTEASVLLVLGRSDEAVKRLEDAVLQLPTGQRYFHMTQAFSKAAKRDAARESWLKATKELLLKEKSLHPLERPDFQKFNAEFATE